jgi:hypothetical protein
LAAALLRSDRPVRIAGTAGVVIAVAPFALLASGTYIGAALIMQILVPQALSASARPSCSLPPVSIACPRPGNTITQKRGSVECLLRIGSGHSKKGTPSGSFSEAAAQERTFR